MQFVLVIGVGRSGTTLMQRILNTMPLTNVCGENHHAWLHAARALDTLDGMSEELDALRGAERGRLPLAASTTPGTYVLPSILQCFADRHPGVGCDLRHGGFLVPVMLQTVAGSLQNPPPVFDFGWCDAHVSRSAFSGHYDEQMTIEFKMAVYGDFTPCQDGGISPFFIGINVGIFC